MFFNLLPSCHSRRYCYQSWWCLGQALPLGNEATLANLLSRKKARLEPLRYTHVDENPELQDASLLPRHGFQHCRRPSWSLGKDLTAIISVCEQETDKTASPIEMYSIVLKKHKTQMTRNVSDSIRSGLAFEAGNLQGSKHGSAGSWRWWCQPPIWLDGTRPSVVPCVPPTTWSL